MRIVLVVALVALVAVVVLPFAHKRPPTAERARIAEPPRMGLHAGRKHGRRPPRPSRRPIDIDPTFEVPTTASAAPTWR